MSIAALLLLVVSGLTLNACNGTKPDTDTDTDTDTDMEACSKLDAQACATDSRCSTIDALALHDNGEGGLCVDWTEDSAARIAGLGERGESNVIEFDKRLTKDA
jgi:hypothetical protein